MKIAELTEAQDKWAVLDQHVFPQCQKYLEAVQGSGFWFLRGSQTTLDDNFWYSIPQQRTPRNSQLGASQAFDEVMKTFGCKALRLNSIFVTTMRRKAQDYTEYGGGTGKVYLIFPDDNCHYSWTRERDLTLGHNMLPLDVNKVTQWKQQYPSKYSAYDPWIAWDIDQTHKKDPQAPSLASMIDRREFEEQFSPGCDNIPQMIQAMQMGREIFVSGGKYLAISITFPGLNAALKKRGLPPIQSMSSHPRKWHDDD